VADFDSRMGEAEMTRLLVAKRIILILGLVGLAGNGATRFYQQFTSTKEMDSW